MRIRDMPPPVEGSIAMARSRPPGRYRLHAARALHRQDHGREEQNQQGRERRPPPQLTVVGPREQYYRRAVVARDTRKITWLTAVLARTTH
jgi:hypothetical protein